MTSYPIGIFLVAALALGQDGGIPRPNPPSTPDSKQSAPDSKPSTESSIVHRLDTVVWNPSARELSWVVSVWDLNGKMEAPMAKQAYAVRLDNATMKSNGETRTFDADEAKQVRLVMDMISAYAVGSTVWWERGEGGKVEGKDGEKEECPKPDKDKGLQPAPEKNKGAQPAPSATPPTRVLLQGPIAATLPLPQASATRR